MIKHFVYMALWTIILTTLTYFSFLSFNMIDDQMYQFGFAAICGIILYRTDKPLTILLHKLLKKEA